MPLKDLITKYLRIHRRRDSQEEEKEEWVKEDQIQNKAQPASPSPPPIQQPSQAVPAVVVKPVTKQGGDSGGGSGKGETRTTTTPNQQSISSVATARAPTPTPTPKPSGTTSTSNVSRRGGRSSTHYGPGSGAYSGSGAAGGGSSGCF